MWLRAASCAIMRFGVSRGQAEGRVFLKMGRKRSMIIAVTGGAGSGKSAYAERCALSLTELRQPDGALTKSSAHRKAPLYLATMRRDGEEADARIRRHRNMRRGKGFQTLEKASDLSQIPREQLCGRTVLLEDLSNLIANEMFPDDLMEPGFRVEDHLKDAEMNIREGLAHVASSCENLVVVMNEVSSDSMGYDHLTNCYIGMTARMNAYVAAFADGVQEVVYGIPVRLK